MTLPPTTSGLAVGSVCVLVLEAHAPTRLGIGVLLKHLDWVGRCLLASEREEAITLARRHRPDVAIVDISDAGPFASAITSGLTQAHPAIRIVLSSRCSRSHSISLAAVGATAILPALPTGESVANAVRQALISDSTASVVNTRAGELTEREREILELLSTGATNREIAAHLHLGPDAIKKHATSLYRKLGVRNRTEAAQRAGSLIGVA